MSVSEPSASSPSSSRARGREETRRRLLISGAKLFAQRGLNGVTTHDIAREAGVASGTFYLHFPDKSSLFHEIAVDTEARLRAHIEQATAFAADLRGAIRSQVEALFDFAAENRDLIRILFGPDGDSLSGKHAGSELLASIATSIEEGRRRAIASGEMPREIDAAVVSQALVGMLSRVLVWWIEDPDLVARETVIETLTRIQLSGTHPA